MPAARWGGTIMGFGEKGKGLLPRKSAASWSSRQVPEFIRRKLSSDRRHGRACSAFAGQASADQSVCPTLRRYFALSLRAQAKQSMSHAEDCGRFGAHTARNNVGQTHLRIPAAQKAPELCKDTLQNRPRKQEGAGKTGWPHAPGAPAQRTFARAR